MTSKKTVAARLPAKLVDGADRMVESGEFENRTEALEVALSELLKRRSMVPETGRTEFSVHLPDEYAAELEFLTGVHKRNSAESIIYEAVVDWLDRFDLMKEKKRAEDRKEIMWLVQEEREKEQTVRSILREGH